MQIRNPDLDKCPDGQMRFHKLDNKKPSFSNSYGPDKGRRKEKLYTIWGFSFRVWGYGDMGLRVCRIWGLHCSFSQWSPGFQETMESATPLSPNLQTQALQIQDPKA